MVISKTVFDETVSRLLQMGLSDTDVCAIVTILLQHNRKFSAVMGLLEVVKQQIAFDVMCKAQQRMASEED